MKKQSVLMSAAVTALLVLLGSCMSPLSSLTQGGGTLPTLGAQDVRLVFNTSDNRAPTAADGATFLTVQLESVVDGTVKFASATKGIPIADAFTVTVNGMIGGEWKLRARFWDTEANKALLYYANTREILVPGQAKTVALTVFPVASIGQVDVIDAKMPHHVSVLGQDGKPSAATAIKLGVGTTWSLEGITYSDADEKTPASIPGVLWSSDKESIAVVSTSGKVTILRQGNAIITATSILDPAYKALYKIEGVSPVYGSWKMTMNDMMGWQSNLYRYDNSNFTAYNWDSEGHVEVLRGPYTLNGSILTMKPNQTLDTSLDPPAWVPVGNGEYEEWMASVEIMGNVLVMTPMFSGAKASFSREMARPMPYYLVFNKAVEKSAVSVTVANEPANFTMFIGSRLYSQGVATLAADATNATIDGVIWKTDTPAVLGPTGIRDNNFQATGVGDAILTAYALDSDFDNPTVFSTLTATVVINDPPAMVPNTSQYTKLPGSATFNFDVTDTSGLSSVEWSLKSMGTGYQLGTGTVSNVTGNAVNFTVDVSPYTLVDGYYQIQVTAVDKQGTGSGIPQLFDFWVDTTPPTHDLTTYYNGGVQGNYIQSQQSNTIVVNFSDGVGSGVVDGSFSVVGAVANLSIWNISTTVFDSISPTVIFSQTGNVGTITLDLTGLNVTDYPAYPTGSWGIGTVEFQLTDLAGNTQTYPVNFVLGGPY